MRYLLLALLGSLCCCIACADAVSSFSRTVTINGHKFAVQGVRVDLHDPSVKMRVGLALGMVGRTEQLAGIAGRYHAVAAINGSFFDAYCRDALKNPDMTRITHGQLAYKSDLGCLLGFDADNTPHLGSIRYKLTGTTHGKDDYRNGWYAYWLNRKPTSAACITIFTPHWGPRVEAMGGTLVVVQDGVVTAITAEAAPIPVRGFIIHFRGEASMRARFSVGTPVTFSPKVQMGDADTWTHVQEALGCGPRVLANGTPVFAPREEGFNDPKVLQLSGMRSGVGYTPDRLLYLITVKGARVSDLGPILKALGCTEGMNLDGGASSGLWLQGKYLTKPGRAVSNALLVVRGE